MGLYFKEEERFKVIRMALMISSRVFCQLLVNHNPHPGRAALGMYLVHFLYSRKISTISIYYSLVYQASGFVARGDTTTTTFTRAFLQ